MPPSRVDRGRRRGSARRRRTRQLDLDRPATYSGSGTRSGCSRCASSSMPSTSRGPGPGEVGGGVHGHHAARRARRAARAWRRGLRRRPRGVVAARHGDHDLGLRRLDLLPLRRARLLAGHAEHVVAAGELDHLRHPVPADEHRVEPLQRRHARRLGAATAASHRVDPPAGILRQALARLGAPAASASRGTSASTSPRVDGSSESTCGPRGQPLRRRPPRRRRRRRTPRTPPGSRSGPGSSSASSSLVELVERLARPPCARAPRRRSPPPTGPRGSRCASDGAARPPLADNRTRG